MKIKTTIFFLFVLSVFILSCSRGEYKIYVSPNGNDNNAGTLEQPLATLQKAAEKARENTGKVPVTVYLTGGIYRLSEPLKLGAEDGGTLETPVLWSAMSGEKAVISGGIPVKYWREEGGGLWSADLPQNFTKRFRSFYVNNRRAVRARTPNDGYLRVKQAGEDNRTNFFFEKNDISPVKNVGGMELVFLHDWSITRIGVKEINWRRNQLITTDSIGARSPSFFTISNWEKHPRYFLENAMEFCDVPGEWFCDFDKRKIYYRPLSTEKMNETQCIIPLAEKLLVIKGNSEKHAAFIKFKGITFENTEWLLPARGYCAAQACMYDERFDKNKRWSQVPAAIELDLADNCEFYDCIIRHIGGSGIWIRENCRGCEILDSKIYDIAGNGINIGEGRERLVNGEQWWKAAPQQVSKNNRVSNSLIKDCGKQFFGAVGIWGGLVANTVIDHNEIRNLPYTGVSIGWMWSPISTPCRENIINANHIHHVMNILSDGGGIYCLGLQPDSRITNNLIHNVTVNAGRSESNGMFLDEGIKDLVVENNIIYNIARSPIRFHKAFHNIVRANTLVCNDNTPPIRYNATKEENIEKIDNLVLNQSSEEDMKKLETIIARYRKNIGIINNK